MLPRDEEAEFTALVQRQSHFVFRVAYVLLLNSHDAEDAVQETFLKLYRNGGWKRMDNERAFLARVAWRIAVDRRRQGVRREVEANFDVSAAEESVSRLQSPESVLLNADENARIHSMIDTLPEELRVPLVLSAFDELNSREIARILGIPEGTVRTRQMRARQMLRQKLAAILDGAKETPYA